MFVQAVPHGVLAHKTQDAGYVAWVPRVRITSRGALSAVMVAITVCGFLLISYQTSEGADKHREEANFALENTTQPVRECVAALEKAKEHQTAGLIALVNKKIDQLVESNVKAEAARTCEKPITRERLRGMGPVKSKENERATKSCDELRTILVQLLRRTSFLKRRAHSKFSELSSAEKQELAQADQDLKSVVAATRVKCRCGKSAPSLKRGRLEPTNRLSQIGLRR